MESSIIPQQIIENKILFIRGKKVMLDRDLATLYGVETRVLNQAVRRNKKRFPEDFMFQLTKDEMVNWKSQIVISKVMRLFISCFLRQWRV
ncbi:MAG: ORF6N domain-containing protein [Nitrospirae bacterium]|nr:ORF6N domain-containing protein [Nitrospirota bacterium]